MAIPFNGPVVVRHNAAPSNLRSCALPVRQCASQSSVVSFPHLAVPQLTRQWQPQHPQQQQRQQPLSLVQSAPILACPPQAVHAAQASPVSFAGGLFVAGTSGSVARQLTLQRIHVDALVVDRVAVHKLAQTFRNDESLAVQVMYVFPLPDGSSVLGFSAQFGSGRELNGILKKSQEAHSDYISALRAGSAAILLDEKRPDVFQTSIGNLKPGEDVTVQLKYCLDLPVDGHDCIRLTIPACVDPRYTPKSQHKEEQQQQQQQTRSLALLFQGTVLETVQESSGRVLGSFDGHHICFDDERSTTWTRCDMSGAPGSSLVEGAQEVLRLVLMQLLLALRWEPTFLGLGPNGATMAAGSGVAIDACQRPLLCFLVRYALVSRDLVLVSELYWSLWCLSHDVHDDFSGSYEKARWVLVTALQGDIEFWDGDRSIRLDSRFHKGTMAASKDEETFRHRALQLLVLHGSIWRQTVILARLGTDMTTDIADRTRMVRQKLLHWQAERSGQEDMPDLLLGAEDPYLIDIGASLHDRAPVNLLHPGNDIFVSLPVDPSVRFLGLNISGCEILPSNAAPLVLSCWREHNDNDTTNNSDEVASGGVGHGDSFLERSSGASGDGQSPVEAPSREYPVRAQSYMVKVGDDLRQDQLVLQLLSLMERVWQERLPSPEHETLRLAPYRVLAMTPNAGYVKFVPGAVSLSKALYRSRGNLTAWFDHHRPTSMTLAEVLNNLCGSVAAYCVATYCLGIGDRHLDNLQITPEGHFFHIDFGFIFGDDPKPFAPRLRLPQPIAAALLASQVAEGSSPGQTLLDKCFWLAGRAYIALRRSMPLWVSLLRVTGEAGGAGCQRLRASADAAVVMVRDRLRSDLDVHQEEAAAADFLLVLQESTEALYPMLTDKVHQLGLFWK
mmetsp:Transcript_133426/g.266211  ORF Transcript_133426/g.266211 Transcript_133426/m.266211 type:complete len:900 (+) Transcript_133426:90-2789(+)